VEELYGTRYQIGSFSLLNVGSAFHCLRSFFFFFSLKLHFTIWCSWTRFGSNYTHCSKNRGGGSLPPKDLVRGPVC
jgi:hypothetical protein